MRARNVGVNLLLCEKFLHDLGLDEKLGFLVGTEGIEPPTLGM